MRWWIVGLLVASIIMVMQGNWSLYNLIVVTILALIIRAVIRHKAGA